MTTPDLKVVKIREGRPLLNDIPGRLRLLADQIEAGEEFGPVEYAFIILDVDKPLPACLGFGNIPTDRAMLGLIDQAHEVSMQMIRERQETFDNPA